MIHIQRVSDTGKVTEILTIDATLDASIENSLAVTDFPIEEGSSVSDHAQKQPVTVTVRALVSATPLRVFSFNVVPDQSRPRAAFEILEEIQNSKELVRIVTDLRTYDNMVLTNLMTPRRQDTKNALLFTATFREVKLVSSQIVTLPADEDVQQTATSKEEGGKVAPSPTESAKEQEKASLLYRTLQGVGVIE